jgi:hypothetical protein
MRTVGSFGGERARVSESSWALRKSKRRLTVVGGGREDLGLLGGDDSVTGDELGEDTSGRLNTYVGETGQIFARTMGSR